MSRLRPLLLALAVTALAACVDRAAPSSATITGPSLATVPSPTASVTIKMRDDCDSASFNAIVGPGTCVGRGRTTFFAFVAELEATKQAAKWVNVPWQVTAPVGVTLNVVNRGGEVHTLTHVAAFGGGVVKFLNDLTGLHKVAPECLALQPGDFVPHDGSFQIPTGGTGPGIGTHLYECCIHPWMRATVTLN
jgi:hypothetical protein